MFICRSSPAFHIFKRIGLAQGTGRPGARCLSASRRAKSPRPKKVIFSGIQPTGVPHLGNYLGALRQWKYMQDTEDSTTRILFSIVDLHAITRPLPPAKQGETAKSLRRQKRELLACLLAIGLDPDRCALFYQSEVQHHAEMQWILSCTASMGYLSRMTQWKVGEEP